MVSWDGKAGSSTEQQGRYKNRRMLNFGIIYYTEEHDYAFKVQSNSAH